MIIVTQLRIGNIICWNPKLVNEQITLPALQVEVSEIAKHEIGYTSCRLEHRVEPFEDDLMQEQTIYKPMKEFEPVLLTPGILKDSSFNATRNGWEREGFYLKVEKESFVYEVNLHRDKKVIEVHFLHQLQNLFYFLTASEFTTTF